MRIKIVISERYGMHKTGTFSIQNTFAQLPRTKDLQYLNFGTANSSLEIIKAFSRNYRNKPGVIVQQLNEQELQDRTKAAREKIYNELQNCSSNKVILSAEEIIQLSKDELAELIIVCKEKFSNIKAVGYVRSPKSYVESVFQQRLKRSSQTMLSPKVRVNYRFLLEKFDELLGQQNVEIWKFEPETFPRKCVVNDFCNRLGIEIAPSIVQRVNEGLSLPAVQLLYIYRLINKYYKTNKLAQKLEKLAGDKFYLHSTAYQQLADVDEAGLAWLRDRAGINFTENELIRNSNSIKFENEMLSVAPARLEWLYNNIGKKIEIDLEYHDINSIVGLLCELENMMDEMELDTN